MHAIEYSRQWTEVSSRAREGRSALLVAPHFYGKSTLFDRSRMNGQLGESTTWVKVTSRLPALQGGVDYRQLWDSIRGHFEKTPRWEVDDREGFKRAFEYSVARHSRRLLFLMRGSGRGNEENHYEMMALFHKLMVTRPEVGEKVTVIATDDYSLFYWVRRPFLESALHSYQPEIHVPPLDVAEIGAYLQARGLVTSGTEADALASRLFAISGGHPGLVTEMVDGLGAASRPEEDAEWEKYTATFQRTSRILENISRILAEDPDGYCRTALDYRSPAFPEVNSPRVHVLRQIGILQRETAVSVKLCGGVVGTLVAELLGVTTAARHVGTVLSDTGPRMFVAGPLTADDDDIVVVHLSDLHVSQYYRHRFGTHRNSNEHSAGELLRDDLESMRLLGRIDALVITGDMVWSAELEEFLRAKEVVEEILMALELDRSRLLMIPGNHDIRWNPGELANTTGSGRASREAYDVFAALVKPVSVQRAVDALEVTSRSGRCSLRIIGLDSNRVEGPDAPGIGFVARESLLACKRYVLEKLREDREAGRVTNAWIAVHHHIFPACSLPLPEAERRKVSVMANASEVIDFANQMGIEVVLHGHEHQPSVTVARRWPIDEGNVFAPVVSVGAGSFGVSRDYLGPFARNQYFVVHRRTKDIVIRSRCQGAGGVKFVSHSDLQIPRD
jgi:hypothetical protein